MARDVETILSEMRTNPTDVRFSEACKVADHFFAEFGKPRSFGTSHRVYKMPWAGDPRINLQKDGSKAKAYQVRQAEKEAAEAKAAATTKTSGKKGR